MVGWLTRLITKRQVMYYTIYKGSKVPYVGLAKETPFVNGRWLYEPGEIWFEVGETKGETLDRLKEALPGYEWVKWEKKE
jgi:hypothetical protein